MQEIEHGRNAYSNPPTQNRGGVYVKQYTANIGMYPKVNLVGIMPSQVSNLTYEHSLPKIGQLQK